MTTAIRRPSRRRVLQFFAASTALASGAAAAHGRSLHYWRGIALGADAEMILRHESAAEAAKLFDLATAEIERLEQIFSLYRADSILSRLNRDGRLVDPPAELLEVLSICNSVHVATSGAFDPAIQALWSYHAETAVGAAAPDAARFHSLLAASGWRHVAVAPDLITLASPGAALTLNGVAQGYVTDRVAALMRANGMVNLLADLGEIAAIGRRGPGKPWRVGLAGAGGEPVETLSLENSSVATSAPLGTTFDAAGRRAHIVDPRNGKPVNSTWRQISVVHSSAAIADGLSTGLSILEASAIEQSLKHFPKARAIAFDRAGFRAELSAPY